MKTLALLAALVCAVAAVDTSPALRVRNPAQYCSEGQKPCGNVCIYESYSCCPNGLGGCPSTSYCDLAENGEYGCCPNGKTCQGPGGHNNPGTHTLTYEETSTSYWTDTSTSYWTETSTSSWTETSTSTIHIPTYTTSTTHKPGTGYPHPSIVINGTITVGAPPTFTGGAGKRSTISGLYVIEGLIFGFLVLQSLV